MAGNLILISGEEAAREARSAGEAAAAHTQYEARCKHNAAVIRAGNGLAPTITATSIRRDFAGRFLVTDGAVAETKEALGGDYLIDVETLDEAISVARQLPMGSGGVEVRPLTEHGA